MPSARTAIQLALVAFAAIGAVACGRGIGDGCATNIDCSLNADRTCDLSQTGGYCTILQCTPDSCPAEAICVQFESSVSRLARRFCVRSCTTNGDCRGGYLCVHGVIGPSVECPDGGASDPNSGTAPTCSRLVDLVRYDGGPPPSTTGYCVQMPTTAM
jgi:hypothetical protein